MREIKFRIWKPQHKRMDYLRLSEYLGGCGIYDQFIGCNDSDKIWMEYTGFKDKKGTEIYEGDHFGNKNFPVVFSDGCYTLGGLPLKGYLNGEYMNQIDIVKGNIYQND